MILMGKLVQKLHTDKYYMMQWHTQAGNITTNLKIKVDFALLALSAKKVVMWKFNVDESAEGRYDMI